MPGLIWSFLATRCSKNVDQQSGEPISSARSLRFPKGGRGNAETCNVDVGVRDVQQHFSDERICSQKRTGVCGKELPGWMECVRSEKGEL
jgi:hypothetical protein